MGSTGQRTPGVLIIYCLAIAGCSESSLVDELSPVDAPPAYELPRYEPRPADRGNPETIAEEKPGSPEGCQVAADCSLLEDGNFCNGTMVCVQGACVVDAQTVVHCDQGEAQSCQVNECAPATGLCALTNKPNGVQCDDGSLCTEHDECAGGQCQGSSIYCGDDNPCTNDSCDPLTGCTFVPNSAPCDDGDLCTQNDHCVGGQCTGTPNPQCQCQKHADCLPFEDGDLCNGTLQCSNNVCQVDPATVKSCAAEDAAAGECTSVTCEAATGQCVSAPALDGGACSDGDACTTEDHCAAGACTGNAFECFDGEPCTDDGCDSATGCTFAPNTGAPCDDGLECTTNDACKDGVCVGTGLCSCQTTADCAPFEDGDLCNGTLVCDNGACAVDETSIVTCPELPPTACTTMECVASTGECLELPSGMDGDPCDDEDACTTNDHCSQSVCVGAALACDDGDLCTDDACDPAVGCTYAFNAAACDDGNPCTVDDACSQGVCGGVQTTECQCDFTSDCAQWEDGDLCNGTLICAGNKCVVDPASVPTCEAEGGCAVATCEPATGLCTIVAAANGKPCDDGDACTATDGCQSGTCVGTGAVACDDGNPCTDDSCEAGVGCAYAPNDDPCDDGDAWTEGDYCLSGYCQPGDHPAGGCPVNCQAKWHLPCGFYHEGSTGSDDATWANQWYECTNDSYPGGEFAYYFVAPYDGELTLSLTNESTATEVFVLDAGDGGCSATTCAAVGESSVTTNMVAGQRYYVVVDSYWNTWGSYTITSQCTPSAEQVCKDGKDDDGDGAVDCDDADCFGAAECAPQACQPEWVLGCGDSDVWSTLLGGATSGVSSYNGCSAIGAYPGPEYAYVFDAEATGPVTVSLSDEAAETDILVLEGGIGKTCNGATACVASGMDAVSFDAVAGQRYYLVVDGYQGASGSFSIAVDCGVALPDPGPGPGTDPGGSDPSPNPGPGSGAGCTPPQEVGLSCGASIPLSNDAWGFSHDSVSTYGCSADDFSGPEVAGKLLVPSSGTVTVSLGAETAETDLLIVPADGGCDPGACTATGFSSVTFEADAGDAYWVIVDGYQGAVGTFELQVDCAADDVTPAESCANGVDDDGDGAIDCEDADCLGSSADCQPACAPAPLPQATELMCPETFEGLSNDAAGSADLVTTYSCSPDDYQGAEYVYTFVAETSGKITVSLTEEEAETDVLVMEDRGLGCNPASCVDFGYSSVTFDATAGTTYYVAVDGYQGAVGSYTITLTCGG